jgi:hypothetical protein
MSTLPKFTGIVSRTVGEDKARPPGDDRKADPSFEAAGGSANAHLAFSAAIPFLR